MDFGLMFANVGPYATAAGARAVGAAAEAAGLDSLWTVEHVVVPKGYESEYPYDDSGRMPGGEDSPMPDPLIWLSFVAAATSTIKLATGILIVPQRNPVVLAKEIGTLDSLAGGRVLLGVGAGWLAEEFAAIGVPFDERGARLDDHIGALRALWTQSPAGYDGRFTSFDDVYCRPAPAAPVPIIVGGHSKAAARRAGRLGDGFFPGKGSFDEVRELISVMRATAEEHGRDPDAIEITASGAPAFEPDPVDAIGRWAELGVSRMVIPPLTFRIADIGDALGGFGENVIAKVA
jgi:probable F420-dependent oxidoreductase